MPTIGSGITSKDLEVTGLDDVLANLRAMKDLVTVKLTNVVAGIVTDLLAYSQPRVPVDTGELRESGTASIKAGRHRAMVVATGNADGTVTSQLSSITKQSISNTRMLSGEVNYTKMREGFDVAVFTHENLSPYTGEHGTIDNPIAQTPGTGPKYLAMSWLERQSYYVQLIQEAMSNKSLSEDVALISRIKKRRTGKYTVDEVELVQSRIDSKGYYGGANRMFYQNPFKGSTGRKKGKK
jgi:hypothetical protein